MPISDLLAQISGGKTKTNTAPTLQRTTSVPAKRKPDDDLRGNDSKTLRTSASAPGSVKANAPQGQYTGSARPSNTLGSKSVGSTPRVANSGPPSRPSPAPAAAAPPRAPPKKGSFAEILARGQRAQAAMGQVGKIQHKKVEKGAVKKTRDEPQPVPIPAKGRVSGDYAGTAKPGQRNGHIGAQKSPVKDAHPGLSARPPGGVSRDKSKAAAAAAAAAAAKKLKKAAAATTGYTGTARPKPGNPVRKKDAPRGGALLNAPRHTSSKTSRYEDDYDEELDDFIDYDDEEEEEAGGPRYDDASDGSSDMEAGLDDIDHEERRAEFIGRREDIEEERLEKTLKAAKEARKRRALEEMRARRR
ncbi:hypothetical protein C2857_006235 [Epichloe festucae Fl1]|uniref:SPT2 chromatin protein n=1 Tax=Epichloe festucae (strain Fl1) TaxID=877507 RepID=A0A7S9KQ48_EPIFF|nr:hypothetical protein C2857_006235 [Epichloe festucae Fl1]